MKITQYCSVCKEELAMEVVPTKDGDEDSVLWLRCPRCQGYLPKISSSITATAAAESSTTDSATAEADTDLQNETATVAPEPTAKKESLAAYAALLAEKDLSTAKPYRPWQQYEIGDVIHHLAWDDFGVVVAKETLPGERCVVKVYFERTGVARLIEEDTSSS